MNKHGYYFTLREKVQASFTVKSSRFIGSMAPAATEEAARRFVEDVKAEFSGATHHAYAYRIGSGAFLVERAFDDREPAGTAGPPMLQVLRGEAISGAVAVGTRYFGGIKLGIGGLVRAYRDCARACLKQASLVVREELCRYRLTVSYAELGSLLRHIETLGGEIVKVDYSGAVSVTAALPCRNTAALEKGFTGLSRGQGRMERLNRE